MKTNRLILLLVIMLINVQYNVAQEPSENIDFFLKFHSKPMMYMYNWGAKSVTSMSLEYEIKRIIKKTPELKKYKDIRMFHLNEMYVPGYFLKDKNYIDYSFLNDLVCGYYRKRYSFFGKKEIPRTRTLLTDSAGNYLGEFYLGHIYLADGYKPDVISDKVELAKMFYNNEIDYVFYSLQWNVGYFCIKDHHMFVLEKIYSKEDKTWELKYIPWEEFLELEGISVSNAE